ncbi:SbcC/MukB-like Walker B domain-containing protein [Sphaerisporangium rhizosphaerae]|uniref:SbcC/MukB-like Walker B domain-containing protein n=1 Tax=Sphaerisporangium rhizosphaerae TaxID=2269375 RepID=A0ABW2PAF4_9ACTN
MTPALGRFKPSRAGVINIWDYIDEEFVFADGRLVLRGHNGSGKTKALEVLFPFILDGVSDARRLDPFSGENRTMKSNLLYRGQEAEYGYVWMEFTRDDGAGDGGAQAVTLVIGLRAHRHRDGVASSFFVTGRRVGVDFGLLSADSRPLTEKQLRASLEPGARYRTATEYRAAVDARLFGLGRERYAQLLDLLLALRRPLLAKDLDPVKVSDTLSAGLSPIDPALVEQAARDFENLAAVQRLFDDLTLADGAVKEFLDHYTAYLRAHIRHQLDRVGERVEGAAGVAARVAQAEPELRRARAARQEAAAGREAAQAELDRYDGRLSALKQHDAYQARGELDGLRRQVAGESAGIDAERRRLDQAREHVARLGAEAAKVAGRLAGARAEADRHLNELAEAAGRAGVAGGAEIAEAAPEEGLAMARARAAARRGDVETVRGHLAALEAAEARRGRAERSVQDADQAVTVEQRALASAQEALEEARTTASAALSHWAAQWITANPAPAEPAAAPATAPDAPATAPDASATLDGAAPAASASAGSVTPAGAAPAASAAPDLGGFAAFGASALPGGWAVATPADLAVLEQTLAAAGEPGAPRLPEAFGELTEERRAEVIEARARVRAEHARVSALLGDLRAERDAVAAERDDAPPGEAGHSGGRGGEGGEGQARPAGRGRSGDRQATAGEGWATAGERRAIAADEPWAAGDEPRAAVDGSASAGEGRAGAPLWRLVRFADGVDERAAAGVEGALEGAGLLTAWIHPDPALTMAELAAGASGRYLVALPEERRPGGRTLAAVLIAEDQDMVPPEVVETVLRSIALGDDLAGAFPVVSTDARYGLGPHLGGRPKAAAEYIGATARAARRASRLAGYDGLIAERAAALAGLEEESERLAALVAGFGRARKELPGTAPVVAAARGLADRATRLAVARARLEQAGGELVGMVAEVGAAGRRLRKAAAELSMPRDPREVDAVAQALDDLTRAAEGLRAERDKAATAQGDLAERERTAERLGGEHAEAAAALAAREAAHAVLAERLETLERTFDADLRDVLGRIAETEGLIERARAARDERDRAATREREAEVLAGAELEHARESLTGAFEALAGQVAELVPYTQADLRPLAGVADTTPWPRENDPRGPEQAAKSVADLMLEDPAPGPLGCVRATLPPDALTIIDAFEAATGGGRAVTEATLKNTLDRVSNGLRDFQAALERCQEDYRLDWEPGAVLTVHVIDADGRVPVAAFARGVAERAAEQGVLLEDRERTVLEDELLAGLARQIHARVAAARELVRGMNADTRSKPMSSGTTIGIRWVQSDRIDDAQRAVAGLLVRDADALGRQGLATLRGHLRRMIRDHRGRHSRATYKEALAAALDYRSWYTFELLMARRGEPEVRLTRARHSQMSGGEKSASIHLPLFAAANALYSSGRASCPRVIALDEAFAGIDDNYKPELLGLTVRFGLDLLMTGHDLWCTYPTVPMIAHYDLMHDSELRTVSTILALWDGAQVFDADAGYAGNDELVEELLGFTPRRHVPPGSAQEALYADEDDEEEWGSAVPAEVNGPNPEKRTP